MGHRIIYKNNKKVLVEDKPLVNYKDRIKDIEAKMRWLFFNKEPTPDVIREYNRLEKEWKEIKNQTTKK